MNDELVLKIEKLNERGYGIAYYNDKEIQLLNALPGEVVKAKIFKKKRRDLFAQIEEFIETSPNRLTEKEDHYLSCSPWQIVDIEKESEYKNDLITDLFKRNEITLPAFDIVYNNIDYGYRNKIEFSLYGHSDEHVTVAFHKRESSFAKIPADGCLLAPDKINDSLKVIMKFINDKQIHARQLKGVLLRYSYLEKIVLATIFVKDPELQFSKEEIDNLLSKTLVGISLVYSDFRSPAFIQTSLILNVGQLDLKEKILDKIFTYSIDGFFQINPPVFEEAVRDIKFYVSNLPKNLVASDIYAGVGSIGLSISELLRKINCVEITPGTKKYADLNASENNITNYEFHEGLAEKEGLEFIKSSNILILDPPRNGVHKKVLQEINLSKPEYIIYLSCNPKTQAENIKEIIDLYDIDYVRGYNFYPHTPHVEFLCILKRK